MKKDTILNHVIKCIEIKNNLIKNYDYVVCEICNFHAQNLGIHLKRVHNLSSDAYLAKFINSKLVSEKSFQKYSKSNSNRDSYREYCAKNNLDFSEYQDKMSIAVSQAIMSNPEERARRSEYMKQLQIELNKSPEYKQKISNTAKNTSSRPEILQQRSERLKNWRDKNPEEFYTKCTFKMINTWHSKPEKTLFEFLLTLSGFDFKFNKFIKSSDFDWSSKRKQMDVADIEKRIYIEFDGIYHFKDIFGKLSQIQHRDKMLENLIIKNKWLLIRVSYDQFIYKNSSENSYFEPSCLEEIIRIIKTAEPGVFKIGKKYE